MSKTNYKYLQGLVEVPLNVDLESVDLGLADIDTSNLELPVD